MADQTARQIESMSTRVFVLERLLAAILDTLVTRGRISHSDVALALEQLEADLQIRGAGNKLVVEGLPTNEIKKQLSMFRHSLGLDL